MRQPNTIANRLALILGTICAALLAAVVLGHASDGNLSEEFHHTYPISATGTVALENINGGVHISAWDRDEVRVDAVKRAWTKERLDAAEIKVSAAKDRVSIRTDYSDDHTYWNRDHDNPASVEYTLTVPRGASLDKIELINGSLEVEGVAGEVHASSINGHLNARGLEGRTKLETINSRLEAQFEHLTRASIDLNSVNGSVLVTLPSDASAELEASTVSGRISNDFGLRVNNHRFVGHDLHGQLGNGGPHIRLENVNGRIEIHHALDNRPLSPAKDFNQSHEDEEEI